MAGEFFKILRFLLLFRSLGPLVICVTNVAKGALKTFPIYIIIFASYGLFMWGMFKPFHQAFRTDKEEINLMYEFFYISDTAEPRNSGPRSEKKNLTSADYTLTS